MTAIFFQGFLLQASLILALGAQNIFVLNSGLKKERHLLVASISSICDASLIFIGVLGVATFFIQVPILKIVLGFFGVGFLAFYGIKKFRDASSNATQICKNQNVVSVKQTIMMSLGFSLLNPHVYLDTVVLIGGYSSKFSSMLERFYFGLGASSFSIVWFFGLSILASALSQLLNNPRALRLVSLSSGVVLIFLAIKLGLDVLSWAKIFLL